MTGGATLPDGRALPHNTHAERVVLGAILRDSNTLDAVRHLKPEDFYWPRHVAMFRAMLTLDSRDEPITALSVYRELKRTGEDGLLPREDGGAARVH